MPTQDFNLDGAAKAWIRIPALAHTIPTGVVAHVVAESNDLSSGNFLIAGWVALKDISALPRGIFCFQVRTTNVAFGRIGVTGNFEMGLSDGTNTELASVLALDDDIDDNVGAGFTDVTGRGFVPYCFLMRVVDDAGDQTIEASVWSPLHGWNDAIVGPFSSLMLPAPGGIYDDACTGWGTALYEQASQIPVNQYPDKPATMIPGPLVSWRVSTPDDIPTLAALKAIMVPYIESILDHPDLYKHPSGQSSGWWNSGNLGAVWMLPGHPITNMAPIWTTREEYFATGVNCEMTLASLPSYWEGGTTSAPYSLFYGGGRTGPVAAGIEALIKGQITTPPAISLIALAVGGVTTVTFSRSGNILTVHPSAGVDSTFDLTNASYDTLGELVTALNALLYVSATLIGTSGTASTFLSLNATTNTLSVDLTTPKVLKTYGAGVRSTVIGGRHVWRDPFALFPTVFTPRTTLYPQTTTGSRTGGGYMPLLAALCQDIAPASTKRVACRGQSWCNYGDSSFDNDSFAFAPGKGIQPYLNNTKRGGNDLRQGVAAARISKLNGFIFDTTPYATAILLDQYEGRIAMSVRGGQNDGGTQDYYHCVNGAYPGASYSLVPSSQRRSWCRFCFGDRNISSGGTAGNITDGRYCGGGTLYIGLANGSDEQVAVCFERPVGSLIAAVSPITRVDVLVRYPGCPDAVWTRGQSPTNRSDNYTGVTPTTGYTQRTGLDTTVCTAEIANAGEGGMTPTMPAVLQTAWMDPLGTFAAATADTLKLKNLSDTTWITGAIIEIDAFRANSLDTSIDWWGIYDETTKEIAIITEMSWNGSILTVKSGQTFMANGTTQPVGQAGWMVDIRGWASGRKLRIGKILYLMVEHSVTMVSNFCRINWHCDGAQKSADGLHKGPMVVIIGGGYSNAVNGYTVMGEGSGSLNYSLVDMACMPGAISRVHKCVGPADIGILQQTLHPAGPGQQQEWFDVAIRRAKYENPAMNLGALFLPAWNGRNFTETNELFEVYGDTWLYSVEKLTLTRNDFHRVMSQWGIPYVDFFGDSDPSTSFLKGHMADVTHFNHRGNRKIVEAWMTEMGTLALQGGGGGRRKAWWTLGVGKGLT